VVKTKQTTARRKKRAMSTLRKSSMLLLFLRMRKKVGLQEFSLQFLVTMMLVD
jgi:hypothetical protein